MTQRTRKGELTGSVAQCRRHPVKSMQGVEVEGLTVNRDAVVGDRDRGVVTSDGVLLSAKQRGELLLAAADDEGIDLPGGGRFAYGDTEMDRALSAWLGTEVRLAGPRADRSATYRMTFDPPDDDAELVDIPTPAGTFLDLAPVHLLTTVTLHGARAARPDLNWDIRRFRPNLLLDVTGASFVENEWPGQRLAVGDDVVLQVDQPTVRCAMPLRAQPGLDREVGLYRAMTDLNEAFPDHLGAYASVLEPGEISVGDQVHLLS